MKNILLLSVTISSLLLSFFSCKKNAVNANNNSNSYLADLYLLSTANNGQTTGYIKDGNFNKVGDSISPAGIAVWNNDVYVAGYLEPTGSTDNSYYWKNGQRQKLSCLSTRYAVITQCIVADGNFYCSGYVYDNTRNYYIACYWKNGVYIPLSDSTQIKNNEFNLSEANGITVSGTDVYVSGTNYRDIGYWKNGFFIPLSVSKTGHEGNFWQATGIAVSGNDVYVSGNAEDGYEEYYPYYWENGVSHELTTPLADPSRSSCFQTTICAVDKDIYIGGNIQYNFGSAAIFWKNGEFDTSINTPQLPFLAQFSKQPYFALNSYFSDSAKANIYGILNSSQQARIPSSFSICGIALSQQ